MTSREDVFEQVKRIPPLPTAATEVLPLLQDPDADPADIVRAITHDPILTANVLRTANSPMFAGDRTVGSVQEALVRLGTKQILSLVLCSAVGPVASPAVSGYHLGEGSLWEHCVATAVATEKFSAVIGERANPMAFTAGLLCDIGKIAIGSFLEHDYAKVTELAFDRGMSFQLAEREVFGIDHAEAGAVLLEQWNLPEAVCDAVRWHHEPESCPEPHRGIAELVHIADLACCAGGFGTGDDGMNYEISDDLLKKNGLKPEHVEAALCETFTRLSELRQWIGETAGRTVS